ncbi:lactonase family protein [Alkalihalobacillus sp. 1P02AB]|uniref:lactonase family protein n=1 Tax=Alkalihalobacillus sp. 1P02AB TaxID=3132260 RepID=UPI0039A71D69
MTVRNKESYLFIGTYNEATEEAIVIFRYEEKINAFLKVGGVSGIKNPSYLTVNQKGDRLYAVSEVEDGEVVSYQLKYHGGQIELIEMNRKKTKGSSPCYLTLSKEEKTLFAANYGGGNVSAFSLDDDGSLQTLVALEEFNDLGGVSHPHQIKRLTSNLYLIPDLGLNRLFLYRWEQEEQRLLYTHEVAMAEGTGPRHFTFDELTKTVYVVNEHQSTVSAFRLDESKVQLSLFQEIRTIPESFKGDNYGADIHLHPTERLIFTSNRGHHSLSTFQINEEGELMLIDHTMLTGEWPRNFQIDPSGDSILVANERTDSIHLLRVAGNGILEETCSLNRIHKPVCLHIR